MAASNLLERVMKLGEILAAVDYEFGQLTPPQAIADPYIARLLPDLWECAKAATFNADEAMADLVGMLAHWDEIAMETPSVDRASEERLGVASKEG
jgi:hypothetical protein